MSFQDAINCLNAMCENNSVLEDNNVESAHNGATSTSANQDKTAVVGAEVHTNDKLSQNCINVEQRGYVVRKLEGTPTQSSHVRLVPSSDEICTADSSPIHCESFKIFSRRYILRKTLEMLRTEPDETKYYTYKNHLINIEKCFENSSLEYISNDLAVALTNAWHLSDCNDDNDPEGCSNKQDLSTGASAFPFENKEDVMYLEKSKLISSMLLIAKNDDEYCQCLTKLCNM